MHIICEVRERRESVRHTHAIEIDDVLSYDPMSDLTLSHTHFYFLIFIYDVYVREWIVISEGDDREKLRNPQAARTARSPPMHSSDEEEEERVAQQQQQQHSTILWVI